MATYKSVNPSTSNLRSVAGPTPDLKLTGRAEWTSKRHERTELAPALLSEEALVVDDRAALRPAQVVENKLTRMLQEVALPVSHLQMRGILRDR